MWLFALRPDNGDKWIGLARHSPSNELIRAYVVSRWSAYAVHEWLPSWISINFSFGQAVRQVMRSGFAVNQWGSGWIGFAMKYCWADSMNGTLRIVCGWAELSNEIAEPYAHRSTHSTQQSKEIVCMASQSLLLSDTPCNQTCKEQCAWNSECVPNVIDF